MAVIRPTHHPITGEPIPRRSVVRRFSDLGYLDDPGPHFEAVGDDAANKTEARMGRRMRSYLTDRATMQMVRPFPVRGLGSGRKVAAASILVSGLRYGLSGSEAPPAPGNAQVTIALTDDRATNFNGISLSQAPGDDYAFIYHSLTGTQTHLNGSDGQAISFRTHRSQTIGLLADFTTNEAQVITANANGDITVRASIVMGEMLENPSGGSDDAQIRPSISVRNALGNEAGPVVMDYTRLDVDIWTD